MFAIVIHEEYMHHHQFILDRRLVQILVISKAWRRVSWALAPVKKQCSMTTMFHSTLFYVDTTLTGHIAISVFPERNPTILVYQRLWVIGRQIKARSTIGAISATDVWECHLDPTFATLPMNQPMFQRCRIWCLTMNKMRIDHRVANEHVTCRFQFPNDLSLIHI